MNYLGKKGYTINKTSLTKLQINTIHNELNVKPHLLHSIGQQVEYAIYRESETKLYVPRYYGLKEYGNFENKLSKGEIINVEFKGELFPYQNIIIDKYITHVKDSGGGLLDVEPGKGKTVMALNIISKLKRKTLVIVHKTFLMNQWIERIQTFLPNATIGKIQGDIIDIEGKDIVLGMLQSLSGKLYDSTLWEQFGLCIFDECHHLSAEVFSNVMINIVTNYNLGLSGTMKRKDGLSKVFEYFIGPIVHKEKTDITTEVLIKTINVDYNDFDNVKTDFRGNPMYSTMINVLDCKERNDFIINMVKYELNQNNEQQIMILSNTKSLINNLYEGIKQFEESIGFYLGGMKEDKLKESEGKKVILATYAMASEGLDIKTLTTLIMATPKSDVCQSVGRILRSKHSTPLVIDIIDNHQVFHNQYKKRCVYYNSKKYKIQNYTCPKTYLLDEYSIKEAKEKNKKIKCLIKI
uniref:Helicase ATP-binding domain-containing protein n=1 Tax=viral metagenome TaxID=1070528 RepID=A0A6C0ESV5_9ZZZZ